MNKLITATIAFVCFSGCLFSQKQINTSTNQKEIKEVKKVEPEQKENTVLSPASENRKPSSTEKPKKLRENQVSPAKTED